MPLTCGGKSPIGPRISLPGVVRLLTDEGRRSAVMSNATATRTPKGPASLCTGGVHDSLDDQTEHCGISGATGDESARMPGAGTGKSEHQRCTATHLISTSRPGLASSLTPRQVQAQVPLGKTLSFTTLNTGM